MAWAAIQTEVDVQHPRTQGLPAPGRSRTADISTDEGFASEALSTQEMRPHALVRSACLFSMVAI
jgi:hypothetical protein